jgi:hypothetical protein
MSRQPVGRKQQQQQPQQRNLALVYGLSSTAIRHLQRQVAAEPMQRLPYLPTPFPNRSAATLPCCATQPPPYKLSVNTSTHLDLNAPGVNSSRTSIFSVHPSRSTTLRVNFPDTPPSHAHQEPRCLTLGLNGSKQLETATPDVPLTPPDLPKCGPGPSCPGWDGSRSPAHASLAGLAGGHKPPPSHTQARCKCQGGGATDAAQPGAEEEGGTRQLSAPRFVRICNMDSPHLGPGPQQQ